MKMHAFKFQINQSNIDKQSIHRATAYVNLLNTANTATERVVSFGTNHQAITNQLTNQPA